MNSCLSHSMNLVVAAAVLIQLDEKQALFGFCSNIIIAAPVTQHKTPEGHIK